MAIATDDIHRQILKVINQILFVEKKKVLQYKDVSLYPSEVHLMLVLKNEIDTNATEIARRLGVTKGAVSQTLSRLEKKGVVRKEKDPFKKNELTVSLTAFGNRAYTHCLAIQQAFHRANDAYVADLKPKEREVIFNFLKHMENTFESTG